MNKNENDKIRTALLQMLVMMFTAIGGEHMKSAIVAIKTSVEDLLVKGELRALTANKKDALLELSDKPHTGKITAYWYKLMANTIGLYYGVAFYESPKGGRSGFNDSNSKAVSIAILQHMGIIDEDLNWCFRNEAGNLCRTGDFMDVLADLFVSADVEVFADDLGVAVASVEADEFAEFAEVVTVKASDSVIEFNALGQEARDAYPLTGLIMSFFEMLKTCGSVTGTVLNWAYRATKDGKIRSFRPSDGAKAAIKAGKDTYRNGSGTLKELTCMSSFTDTDKDNNTVPIHLSLFNYTLAAEVVLKSLGFNYNNVKNVFYHMKDEFFGGDINAALNFTASGMRLILNAVDNGAPSNEVGVGFTTYLSDDDIFAIIDANTEDGEFYERLALSSGGGSRGRVAIDPTFDNPLA